MVSYGGYLLKSDSCCKKPCILLYRHFGSFGKRSRAQDSEQSRGQDLKTLGGKNPKP